MLYDILEDFKAGTRRELSDWLANSAPPDSIRRVEDVAAVQSVKQRKADIQRENHGRK